MNIVFDLPEEMIIKLADVDHVYQIADYGDSLIPCIIVNEQKANNSFDEDKYRSWCSHQHSKTGMKTLGKFKKAPICVEVKLYDFPWSSEKVAIVSPTSKVVDWDMVEEYIQKTFAKAIDKRNWHNDNATQHGLLYWLKENLK